VSPSPLPGFVARDAGMLRLLELAARAAGRAASVLVTGESGAGKSHLARCMHDLGRGADRPFVIIDCGNIPEGLVENELFGHEAGAYSGATGRRPGKFEAADGGTALLDRVTELPLEAQGKLLRVLQERAFERVGGQQTIRVDVTVMATAGDDVADLVGKRLFREDLYYRLDVVHFAVPPLRERPDDVEPLAELFLDRVSQRTGSPLRLAPDAAPLLRRHSWPGNVRELQNALERAAVVAPGPLLGAADLEPALGSGPASPSRAIAELASAKLSLEAVERLYIARILESVGGRVGEAAGILGIHRKTLLDKRKRYGLR
jgi:DNA-binding NtrC family response regulator